MDTLYENPAYHFIRLYDFDLDQVSHRQEKKPQIDTDIYQWLREFGTIDF